MKIYVGALVLFVVHNVCAMELDVVRDRKRSDIARLLEKHSRIRNHNTRMHEYSLLLMNIRQQLPIEIQKNIFMLIYEVYEIRKKMFINGKVFDFTHSVNRGNKFFWLMRVRLKDDYKTLLKNDLCQLFNKAEAHSYLQKGCADKVLMTYGINYIMDAECPLSIAKIDMADRITSLVKERYDPIVMLFWYAVNKKLML